MNQLVVSARWLFVQANQCTQWTPKHFWMSDRPKKEGSGKEDINFVSGVVVISYFVDGAIHWQCKTFLAYECGGFGKVSHLYY